MIRPTSHDWLARNSTSLSLVALERLIGGDLHPTRDRGELPVRAWVPDVRTTGGNSDLEVFKGMRTPFDQRRCQQMIYLMIQHQRELPEVETAREGQQSTGDPPSPSPREL